MQGFLDIWNVARNELQEAVRSRRVLILALVYVGGAVIGTVAFAQVLSSLEEAVQGAVSRMAAMAPGQDVSTDVLVRARWLPVLQWFVGDEAIARELIMLPPIALFYGWTALNFIPVMVVLTSAECVSSELVNGAARYVLLRVPPLRYSAGKLVGQWLLMVGSIVAGAVAVWITGYLALERFDGSGSAWWLLRLSGRAALYGFAYIGLAVGISHGFRSVPLSRAAALGSLLVMGLVAWMLEFETMRSVLGPVAWAAQLLPSVHRMPLWHPEFMVRLPALVAVVFLGLAYFAMGFVYRRRRDW